VDTQAPSTSPDQNERLESWKEIAAYLNRGVRTVIRWEKTEGLPVHRHQHQRKASVFAYRAEIDAWWQSRHPDTPTDLSADPPPAGRIWFLRPVGVVTALVVLSAAFSVWQVQVKSEVRMPSRGQPLTSYPGQQFSPAFSPDGTRFAFAWNGVRPGNVDIYTQSVGSEAPQRLTDHPDVDFSPAWSPDGKWLAFLRRTPGMDVSIFLMPALGGPEQKLLDLHVTHYMDGTQLGWSPDSTWLAVGDTNQGRDGLFLVHAETREIQPLTTTSIRRGHLDPAFSPDGRHLAFRCADAEDEAQICVMPLSQGYRPAGASGHNAEAPAGNQSGVDCRRPFPYLFFRKHGSGRRFVSPSGFP
jgi:tricorn protease-like protein